MIDHFETSVRIHPNSTFFTFTDSHGSEIRYTYRQARLVSASLAQRIRSMGVRDGDYVACDLPNVPEFVFLLLAASYGGFTLILLKHGQPDSVKQMKLTEIERDVGRIALAIDERTLLRMLGNVRDVERMNQDESGMIERISGSPRWKHAIIGEEQDAIDDTIHFAERAAHLFEPSVCGLVIFTPGRASLSKAVPLTWKQLVDASLCINETILSVNQKPLQRRLPLSGADDDQRSLLAEGASSSTSRQSDYWRNSSAVLRASEQATNYWQCVLPLCHVGGLQAVVRSVITKRPFKLYEHFDAEIVLHDCERDGVTHIAVSDRMMQDLLTVEEWRADISPTTHIRLNDYECILLGGHRTNPRTIERAVEIGCRLYPSYGIAETSSVFALSHATPEFKGGLAIADGYSVHIIDPDEEGFGRLAVRGPGVFDGYLNARAPFTLDHYFVTSDIAAISGNLLYIKDRTANMFVANGENIYPAELSDAIRRIPGVQAAHVFGVPDIATGNRAVAVVERESESVSADDVISTAKSWLGDSNVLENIHVVDALPRTPSGRIDREAIEKMFRVQLRVRSMEMLNVKVPSASDQAPAKEMSTVIVRMKDILGRTGIGECLPSVIGQNQVQESQLRRNIAFIKDKAAKVVMNTVWSHPRELAQALAKIEGAQSHPLATYAIEMAAWDLYCKAAELPFWKAVNNEYEIISKRLAEMAGTSAEQPLRASAQPTPWAYSPTAEISGNTARVRYVRHIDGGTATTVLAETSNALSSGYTGISIDIAPGLGFASVRAVRRNHPDIFLTLNAKHSFTFEQIAELKAFDALNAGWIVDPFKDTSDVSFEQELNDLGYVQQKMDTPICSSRQYNGIDQASVAMTHPSLPCVPLWVPELGGIENAISFVAHIRAIGKGTWVKDGSGSMLSAMACAAFETLPDIVFPGEFEDVLMWDYSYLYLPENSMHDGIISLNIDGFEHGLGCIIDSEGFEKCCVEHILLD